MNRRVNFIGIDNGTRQERIPYCMINNQRRGYWNQRQANRRRQGRGVREDDRGRRIEDRNDHNRSPSPTMQHPHDDNPVERLLIDQNARRADSNEDRRPWSASGSLNQ